MRGQERGRERKRPRAKRRLRGIEIKRGRKRAVEMESQDPKGHQGSEPLDFHRGQSPAQPLARCPRSVSSLSSRRQVPHSASPGLLKTELKATEY